MSPDLKKAFIVDAETVNKYGLEREVLRPVYTGGKLVKRYYCSYPDLSVIYGTNEQNIKLFPRVKAYIDSHRKDIMCKEVKLKSTHCIPCIVLEKKISFLKNLSYLV